MFKLLEEAGCTVSHVLTSNSKEGAMSESCFVLMVPKSVLGEVNPGEEGEEFTFVVFTEGDSRITESFLKTECGGLVPVNLSRRPKLEEDISLALERLDTERKNFVSGERHREFMEKFQKDHEKMTKLLGITENHLKVFGLRREKKVQVALTKAVQLEIEVAELDFNENSVTRAFEECKSKSLKPSQYRELKKKRNKVLKKIRDTRKSGKGL